MKEESRVEIKAKVTGRLCKELGEFSLGMEVLVGV